MIIIVEGVDCGGKGWMAERLLKRIPNCYYIKHGNRPKDSSEGEIAKLQASYKTMLKTYYQAIQPMGGTLIMDRFYQSELVYGSMIRGYDPYNDGFYKELESRVRHEPHLYLEIFAEEGDILKRMEIKGEDYLKQEMVPKIMKGYLDYKANHCTLNSLRVRSSEANVNGIVEKYASTI
tara:strand:+ start:928 stop:1461 length:534 start_codon:yes stop_codon:yes gene_type:complete